MTIAQLTLPEHTLSRQQVAIREEFAGGVRHFLGRARAGTGKTYTILHGITYAPEASIVLAAFNKDNAVDLQRKLQNPRAEARTIHSLGFGCVLRNWKVGMAERFARADSLTERACGGAWADPMKALVTKLHTKARETLPLAESGDELYEIAVRFDLTPDEEWEDDGYPLERICDAAFDCMVLAAAEKPSVGIDFADQIFLPIRNRWMRPRYQLGVIDEAQDWTAAQLTLIMGMVSGRVGLVGDDRQAIYAFRGADAGSLDRLKAELDAKELGLTVTYRCPKAVVAYAQTLVPDYEAHPSAPEGVVDDIPSGLLTQRAEPGDFVLSRTNAPLMKVAMAFVRAQIRVKVAGKKDIGEGIKALFRKVATGPARNSVPALLERIRTWEEREHQRASLSGDEDAVELVHDKAETMRVLAGGVTGLREIEARIDNLFTDDPAAGHVLCSTVHKAKGKEAPHVFVLEDTLKRTGPSLGFARGPVDGDLAALRAVEEQNIEYVAVTRAMEHLTWVQGKTW